MTGRLLFPATGTDVVMTMMTFLKRVAREPTRSWSADEEFVVVFGEFGSVRVSRAVGAWIAERTARRLQPRWLEFVDAAGRLIRVQTKQVQGVVDSTPRQRERIRALNKALEEEDEW